MTKNNVRADFAEWAYVREACASFVGILAQSRNKSFQQIEALKLKAIELTTFIFYYIITESELALNS